MSKLGGELKRGSHMPTLGFNGFFFIEHGVYACKFSLFVGAINYYAINKKVANKFMKYCSTFFPKKHYEMGEN
jgi:hypothetical protein